MGNPERSVLSSVLGAFVSQLTIPSLSPGQILSHFLLEVLKCCFLYLNPSVLLPGVVYMV